MKKYLIIAGGGKGIGRATVELAHEKGHFVFLVTRGFEDFRGAKGVGRRDLNSHESITYFRDLLGKRISKIDAVINCTGTHPGSQKLDDSLDFDIMNLIGENLNPAMHIYQAFLPEFRKKGKGHFVHVSSAALDFHDQSEMGYCASKAALESLVLSMQDGDKDSGIKHHAVRVSLTDTPLARKVCPDIKDWTKFYTAEETATYLIDIVENSENYPKPIVRLPYRPIR